MSEIASRNEFLNNRRLSNNYDSYEDYVASMRSRNASDSGDGVYGYDFSVDTEQLEEVTTQMKDYAEQVREKITELYRVIEDDLSVSWKSTTYDEFRNNCADYRPGLDEMANMLELFGDSATAIAEDSEAMMDSINDKFRN